MTEDKKEELQAWNPSQFAGTDLLPVALAFQKVDRIGRENVEAEDLVLPSLKLLQGSSEEVKKGVQGARAGIFWLTGAEEPFEPPIRVLACAHTKSRSLFPKPDRPEHAGLKECRSRDGVTGTEYGECALCPHKEWDNENKRAPACSESHNFTVLTPLGPAIMRFQRTSIKSAKKLLSLWTMSTDPIFAHPLVISTTVRTDMVQGRPSTTYVKETKWAMKENVPPAAQAAARLIYEQVTAAHEQGKFAAADDEAPAGAGGGEDIPY